MFYGYLDESGAPGVANHQYDYFLVSLVIFNSEENRQKCLSSIAKLRDKLSLPVNYEFHCTTNSTKPQSEFVKLLSYQNFNFITVAIHKNEKKKFASYATISELLLTEIINNFPNIKIEMDSNPILFAQLRQQIRIRKIKSIKIHERKSHSEELIQVADYIANISLKKIKNTKLGNQYFKAISNKATSFTII